MPALKRSIRFKSGPLGFRVLAVSIGIAAALGIAMACVAPVEGDDSSTHLHWISAFYAMLRSGVLIPKWLPDGFHGFGAPTFYFYPPLTYYLSSLLMWVTGIVDPAKIFNLTGLLSSVASGATCYYLLRRLNASKSMAAFGGLFYAFAPYRQYDLYHRSSLSQVAGFIFLPLVLSGIIEIVHRRDIRRPVPYLQIAVLAIGWAGLLLCALPLTLAAAILIAVLWLAFRMTVTRAHVLFIALALVLGTGLAAFHYLSAFYFRHYIQANAYVGQDGNWLGVLLRGKFFRFAVQDIVIYWTQVALLLWWWIHRRDSTRLSAGIAIMLAFLILIETPYLSSPLWNHFFVFQFLQFHIRFGIFAVLLLTIVAFSPGYGVAWQGYAQRIATVWCGVAALLSLAVIFQVPGHPHGAQAWIDPSEYLPITALPDTFAMDRLFLPHLRDSFAIVSPALQERESIHMTARTSQETDWDVDVASSHLLILHQFSWPQWKGHIRDRELLLGTDSMGRVLVPLSPGRYKASLYLEQSSIERVGNVISETSVVVLALLVGYGWKKTKIEGLL